MKTVSFIIPVYNEQQRLKKTLRALLSFYEPRGIKLSQIIFVNDGSTDNTLSILQKFHRNAKNSSANVVIVSYEKNRGKGYAVKRGFEAATSDYALLFDADMSTPLSEIEKFVPSIEKNVDIVIGTRKNGKSTITKHQPHYRELLGKIFTLITRIVLRVNTSDFTCGFKLFSKNMATKLAANMIVDRWGYDAEIVCIAKKFGIKVNEIPVVWANDEKTKVTLYKAIPQSLFELFKIIYHHEIKKSHSLLPVPIIQIRSIGNRLASFFV